MKNFKRENPSFSLCGLNCGLCPMHLGNYCPGCGAGAGNQPCAIARCSQQHNNVEYCFLCGEYPCKKYDCIDAFDSFITHRNQRKDLEKAKAIGIEAYQAELDEKIRILQYLLENCNDGRRKSFFTIAVNLLDLEDLKPAMEQIILQPKAGAFTLKEKAALAMRLLQTTADEKSIVLKLNKKSGKKEK